MSRMNAAACRVDYSPETGSLVVCTCGFVLGPFMDRGRARDVAKDHRRVHVEPAGRGAARAARGAS